MEKKSKFSFGHILRKILGLEQDFISPVPEGTSANQVRAIEPTPTPTPQPNRIDFTGYKQVSGKPLTPPNQTFTDLLFKYFPKEATPAAAVTYGENGLYNPEALGGVNDNGTRDYGLMQINSGTFDGLKERRPDEMAAIGITKDTPYDILYDPEINMKVAQLVRKDEEWDQETYGENAGGDWNRWYGWREPPLGKGINLPEMLKKYKKKK